MNNCKYHWQYGQWGGGGMSIKRVCENTVKGGAVKHDERNNNNIDAVICVSHRSSEPR